MRYSVIKKNGEPWLAISFRYDQEKIEKIRQCRGRFWDPQNRCWMVHLTQENLDILTQIWPVLENLRSIAEKRKIKIVVNGSKAYILTKLERRRRSELSELLSFVPKGAEYIRRHTAWNGVVQLFNERTQSFPSGLVSRVKKFFENQGEEVIIIDKTKITGKKFACEWRFPYKLRDYQRRALEEMKKTPRLTIALPTGSGKTVIALRYIYETRRPTLIIVHMQHLMYQWAEQIKNILGVEPGIWGAGEKKPSPQITVAMLQTLTKTLPPYHFDVIIVDEAHHIPARTLYRTAMRLNAKYVYGLSATPWREDMRDMQIEAVAGPCFNVPAASLIGNILAKPRVFFVRYKDSPMYSGQYAEIYNEKIVHNKTRNTLIANIAYVLWRSGHRVYIDVKRVEHGKILVDYIRVLGAPARFLCGDASKRKRRQILAEFEYGANRFILVSTLIREGTDLPSMSACVLAGAGASSVQVIQTIGRALRPKPDNNEAIIIDFIDSSKYLRWHSKKRRLALSRYYGNSVEIAVVDADKIFYMLSNNSLQK